MIIKIVRHEKDFTFICNQPLQDCNLSFRARGILSFLLSKSKDWEVKIAHLVDSSPTEGRDAIYSALKELRRYGYAMVEDVRVKGRMVTKQWTIWEVPPKTGLPYRATPYRANPCTTNNGYKQKNGHDHPCRGGSCASFGLNGKSELNGEESRATKLTERFVQFTIENRLYVGRKGSTIKPPGWTKHILEDWKRHAAHLLRQVNPSEVKRVFCWYRDHFREDYVPHCYTLKIFCERFVEVKESMRRATGEEEEWSDRKPSITVYEI